MGTRRFVLLLGLLAASASAQDIKPFQAQPVRPAQSIEPARAQEVQPVRPAQVQIVRPVQNAQPVPPQQDQRSSRADRREREERQAAKRQPQASVAALLGVWQTNIPGVAYTTPSGGRATTFFT
jgi:hypothetical protein